MKKGDKDLVFELIQLVYSTNPEGQERKLGLKDKLVAFNCVELSPYVFKEVSVNNNPTHKLFIIGLFLGDGSLSFIFDAPISRAPRFYVKVNFNFAAQKALDSNLHLLGLIAQTMGLEENIYIRNNGMAGLEYSGDIVYKKILPFLNEHYE